MCGRVYLWKLLGKYCTILNHKASIALDIKKMTFCPYLDMIEEHL